MRRASLIGFATDRYGPRGFAVLAIVYRVVPTSKRIRVADDVSEARWFNIDAPPFSEIAFPGLRRFLRRYLKSPRR